MTWLSDRRLFSVMVSNCPTHDMFQEFRRAPKSLHSCAESTCAPKSDLFFGLKFRPKKDKKKRKNIAAARIVTLFCHSHFSSFSRESFVCCAKKKRNSKIIFGAISRITRRAPGRACRLRAPADLPRAPTGCSPPMPPSYSTIRLKF